MAYISCFVLATLAIGAMAQDFTGYARAPGNCPGSVLSEQTVANGKDCADLCSRNDQCKGFTIGNAASSSGRLCILKSDICAQPQESNEFTFHSKIQTKQAFIGGFIDHVHEDIVPWYPPAPYAAPVPAPVPYGGYYYGGVPGFTRANGNCQGNFLSGVLALPLEQCAAQCMTTPGCAGFSFNYHAPYPQCILKAASCPYPDPGAVFTFFARNGFPAAMPPTYYPQYYPDVYVPDYPPAFPVYSPWTKSARKFFKESSELCSGRILKNPEDLDLDKCADACLADPACTGFSFDNYAKSSPYSCTLRAEACQTRTNSTRWSYFERQSADRSVDAEYLSALESGKFAQAAKTEQAGKPASFFDMQKFFSRDAAATAHHAVPSDEIKRI